MSHLDGRCATDDESVYVESRVGCTSTPGTRGTSTAPFCFAQLGIDAAKAGAKPLVVMRGALTPGFEAAPNTGTRLSIVGQSSATITASSSGSGTAVLLSSGDMYLRGVIVKGTPDSGLGVTARPGATLRLESVKVDSNPKGGVLIDGAFFDLRNVLVIRNGLGIYGTNTTWSGVLINNPPAGAPARLERVSIVQNSPPGLNCSQAVQSTSLLATGNGGLDIVPACAVSTCGSASATCGSDLTP
jgi:hypothetical protein